MAAAGTAPETLRLISPLILRYTDGMIAADQPDFFADDVIVRFSSRSDGTVLDRSLAIHDPAVVNNRRAFCEAQDVSYDDVVYQRIVYSDTATYDVIKEVTDRDTSQYIPEVAADALVTRMPGVGFFLPVADCVATVIYDPRLRMLALLHLGRHSTMTDLLPQMLDKFRDAGSQSTDLLVWMSPSAGREHYRLEYFEKRDDPAWQPFFDEREDGFYIDMAGYNRERCLQAGLLSENIYISSIDTMSDDNYFSHANGDTRGRMGLLAIMRERKH